jgi:hypothetical protein
MEVLEEGGSREILEVFIWYLVCLQLNVEHMYTSRFRFVPLVHENKVIIYLNFKRLYCICTLIDTLTKPCVPIVKEVHKNLKRLN